MDIKKEFEFVLSDKSMKDFFYQLRKEEPVFQHFESLESLAKTINDRKSQNFKVKDACLLTLIERIQTAENKSSGLNLITYLLAPGLQSILKDSISERDDLREVWLNLWWEFLQSIQNYSLSLRQRKVSANLLYETRHRIIAGKKSENRRQNMTKRIGDSDLATAESESSPYYELASALIEGADDAGLDSVDLDLVIASRIYGGSMKALAERWGLKYRTALQKRSRAEKAIRKYWKLKDNKNN